MLPCPAPFLLLLPLLGAAAQDRDNSDQELAREFYQNVADRNFASAYQLLCPLDRQVVSELEYVERLRLFGGGDSDLRLLVVDISAPPNDADLRLLDVTIEVEPSDARISGTAAWLDPLRTVPETWDIPHPRTSTGSQRPIHTIRLAVDHTNDPACLDFALRTKRAYKAAVDDAVFASHRQYYDAELRYLLDGREAVSGSWLSSQLIEALEGRVPTAEAHVRYREAGSRYESYLTLTDPNLLPGSLASNDIVTGVVSNTGRQLVYTLAVCLAYDPPLTDAPSTRCRWVAQEAESDANKDLFDLHSLHPGESRHFHLIVPRIPDDRRSSMSFEFGSVLLDPPPEL